MAIAIATSAEKKNSAMPSTDNVSSHSSSSIILGVSGASGLIYASRTVHYLLKAGYTIDLVASRAAHQVWLKEDGITMPTNPEQQAAFWREQANVPSEGTLRCHAFGNVGASIASGSFRAIGMIVIPCSMSTVGKLAAGLSSDLLERAADVQMKEGRSLIGAVLPLS